MIRFRGFEGDGLAVAAMSDRQDGNCGFSAPQNRQTYLQRLGLDPKSLVAARQVHGANVVVAHEDHRGQGAETFESGIADADAIITNVPNLPIGILIADCTPVWIYDPESKSLGMVHSGWRGTTSRIVTMTVEKMSETFGAIPSNMRALIGPCAGPEAYESSPEIVASFSHSRGRCPDLAAANKAQLLDLGVPNDQIAMAQICTISGGRFYSYRRGDRGALNLAIGAIQSA